VPNGCFPTLGIDQWITLAARTDGEWRALCGVMRRPDLANDAALASVDGRRAHEDRIEVAIRQWLADVRPDIAMVTLQAAGIPAGIAKLPQDLASDPHLLKTGHWQPSDRPFMGPHLLPSVAYREGDSELPYPIVHLAPTLGQHNDEVLRGVLGLSDAEIAELARNDVIGTSATLPKPKKKKSDGRTASAAG
jgi:crotonobetainyl-CoA:carnitine CoA-transferase CaiB-like acyl-CoA transferase